MTCIRIKNTASRRVTALLLALTTILMTFALLVPVSADDLDHYIYADVSKQEVTGNLNNAAFPPMLDSAVSAGTPLFINVACGTQVYLSSAQVKINGTLYDTYRTAAGHYYRYTSFAWTPSSAGTYSVEVLITDTNGQTYTGTFAVTVTGSSSAHGMYVADGWYIICSAMDTGKAIDMDGASQDDCVQAILYDKHYGDNQKVYIQRDASGYYTMKLKHSGKYLNVYGGYTTQTTDLIQYHWDGTDSNYFCFEDAGNGRVYIRTKLGQTVDLRAANPANCTPIDCYISFHGGTNQQWVLERVSENSAQSEYDRKVSEFLSDSRWKNGTTWGASKTPRLSCWGSSGCCALAADFVAYVHGFNGSSSPWGKGTKFYRASEIQTGDVLYFTGTDHWVAVLYRNGDSLTTVEGNWKGKAAYSTSAYTIHNGVVCRDGQPFRTFNWGVHY